MSAAELDVETLSVSDDGMDDMLSLLAPSAPLGTLFRRLLQLYGARTY